MQTENAVLRHYGIFSYGFVVYACYACKDAWRETYVNQVKVTSKCPACGEPAEMVTHS